MKYIATLYPENMKRFLSATLLGVMISLFSYAQDADEELVCDRAHWTVRAAWDCNIPGDWHVDGNSIDMFRHGNGVSIGAAYHLPVSGKFYVSPGLNFYYGKYSYKDLDVTGESGIIEAHNPKVEETGVRIPLMAGLKFDIFRRGSLAVFTGPQPCIGFSSKIKMDSNESVDLGLLENNYGEHGILRRFDLAWNIGAAVMINHFQVDVTGSLGMLDLNKGNTSFHQYRVSVGLGYNF